MTEERANELLKQFKNKGGEVSFRDYYKYCFTYIGEVGNIIVSLMYGGDADNIYKHSVNNKPIILPDTIGELKHEFSAIWIHDTLNNEKFEWFCPW